MDKEKVERTFLELFFSLKEVPVEDGVTHGGEKLVAAILREHGEHALADRTLGIDEDSTKAYVMQLIGRVNVPSTEVRRRLVSEGLASKDIQIRDAALQMVEDWEDPECLDLLRGHKDPDDVLQGYAREIIAGLEG